METVALVTHKVLFSNEHNENWTTPSYPVGPFVEGAVDLEATGTFCRSSDDDGIMVGKLYEVRDVTLPAFLSVESWVKNCIKWKYTWASGVDPTWSEQWQTALLGLSTEARVACVQLLKTKNFRSGFRASLQAQLLTWLNGDRKFASPFSSRQWECLMNKHTANTARLVDANCYNDRRYSGVAQAA